MRIKVSGNVLHCLLPFAALLTLAAPVAFAAAQTLDEEGLVRRAKLG